MILATVMVMMLVVWIGMGVMASFVEGNEYQAAVEASTDIYKRAKLLSLGYDGSSDALKVAIPEGYGVQIDGEIVPLQVHFMNETFLNATPLTDPMSIHGVGMVSDNSSLMGPGRHNLTLVYHAHDEEVEINWE